MIIQTAVDYLLGRLGDRASELFIEDAERHIRQRRSFLLDAESADQGIGHALAADAEVLQRTLRLCAPVTIGRHFDRAEAVGLGAGGLHLRASCRGANTLLRGSG
jgi:hypothetical protein